MRFLAAFLPLVLAGCTTTAAGLAESDVEMTLTSAKPPQRVALCVAESLIGDNQLRNDGEHYWILRLNMYGVPIHRWDFFPTVEGGTRAELRATLSVNTGDDRVRDCL